MAYFGWAMAWVATAALTAFALYELHSGWVLLMMILPATIELRHSK